MLVLVLHARHVAAAPAMAPDREVPLGAGGPAAWPWSGSLSSWPPIIFQRGHERLGPTGTATGALVLVNYGNLVHRCCSVMPLAM